MSETLILGVRVRVQGFDEAIERFIAAALTREPMRAHFATVHSVVEATRNPRLREVFDSATMVCTDGVPLVWLARFHGFRGERVCGPDTLLALVDRGRQWGLRHFFLGGGVGVPESLAAELSRQFPGLAVAGMESPPFRPMNDAEEVELIERINGSRPDVVWIGLGAPKQEIWAADHAGQLSAPLVLPVGAAFDFYSGRLRRAPRWIQGLGLEWLFRLAVEPRRLWRRYLATNAVFIVLVVREQVRRMRSGR